MYEIKKRRKPKKLDGFHIMQCIVRAVDERFHIDNTFFGIEKENYDNYFIQCVELGYIVRVKGKDFVAEEFNIKPKGHSFHKAAKGKVSVEQTLNYGIGSTKIKYERE